jgi:hypothetical protein
MNDRKIYLNFQNSNENIPPNHSYWLSQSDTHAPLNRFLRSSVADSFQLSTRVSRMILMPVLCEA